MKICFLDNVPISYDESNLLCGGVRGAEKALINLSKEFTILGHKVTVLNNTNNEKFFNDIRWLNIKNYKNNVRKQQQQIFLLHHEHMTNLVIHQKLSLMEYYLILIILIQI